MKEAYDVCIFGAGPAGAATAIRMADSGFAPLVFERPHREKPWGGESFSGAIRQPLMALGLWEVFGAAGHVASYEQRLRALTDGELTAAAEARTRARSGRP